MLQKIELLFCRILHKVYKFKFLKWDFYLPVGLDRNPDSKCFLQTYDIFRMVSRRLGRRLLFHINKSELYSSLVHTFFPVCSCAWMISLRIKNKRCSFSRAGLAQKEKAEPELQRPAIREWNGSVPTTLLVEMITQETSLLGLLTVSEAVAKQISKTRFNTLLEMFSTELLLIQKMTSLTGNKRILALLLLLLFFSSFYVTVSE